jgi:hypothetical protein
MADVKGPAIDPEDFRVVGHCCGIRIPAIQALTDEGLKWELTPESKAALVAQGVLPAEERREPPKAE